MQQQITTQGTPQASPAPVQVVARPTEVKNRRQLYEDYMQNPYDYVTRASKENKTLPELLNDLVPQPDKGSNRPVDALNDILSRANFKIKSTGSQESSDLEIIQDCDELRIAAYAVLDRDYDNAFGAKYLESRVTTEGGQPEGTPLNPRTPRQLVDRVPLTAPLDIMDLTSNVETIATTTWDQPEYLENQVSESSTNVPEATRIPTDIIVMGNRRGRLFKVGRGLTTSREFELDNTRMDGVRRWVTRAALRDRLFTTHEGASILKIQAGTATAGNTFSANDLDAILNVNMYWDQGFNMTTLFARKAASIKWIKANIRQGTENTFMRSPNRFESVLPDVSLGNDVYAPSLVNYVPDSVNGIEADNWLQADDLIGFDRNQCLVLMRRQNGVLAEEHYDPATQVRTRFFTREYGWFLELAGGVVIFQVA